VGADIQKTQEAVQNVDLDNKVQADAFGRVLMAQQNRISGNENALAASNVVNELKVQFPDLFDNPILRTGLPLVPLLFLDPPKKGSGFDSLLTDKRFLAAAAVAGIALINEFRKQEAREVTVTPNAAALTVGNVTSLSAVTRDIRGREISGQSITWTSSDTKVATVDASTGFVTAIGSGTAIITAAIVNTNVRNTTIVTIPQR
ncbi:MAG: Ig-like domain-containing protein, partial [bacterium]